MKTLFVIIFAMGLSFGLSGQRISDLPKSQQPKQAPKTQPVQTTQTASRDSILFEKLEHDYGTIEQGADGNTEFKFTNKGKRPLVLSNVRASCGCTTPEWTRTPVAPGETGVVKVKYNTNLIGSFNKSIIVSSNAVNSSVMLRVKGNVTKEQ